MKHNKLILEAIKRGVQLALDDFDYGDEESTTTNTPLDIIDTEDYAYTIIKTIYKRLPNSVTTLQDYNRLLQYYRITKTHYIPENKKELRKLIENIAAVTKNIDLNWVNISNIKDLTRLFAKLDSLTIDCSEWDTRHVEKFNYVFAFSKKCNIKANNWQFDNANEFDGMFYMSKTSNIEIDADHWNSENVTTMVNMFSHCTNQNSLQYASKLDISSCINFGGMFYNSKCQENLSHWEIPENVNGAFNRKNPFDDYQSMFDKVNTMSLSMLPKIIKGKTPEQQFKEYVQKFADKTNSNIKHAYFGDNSSRFYCNNIIFPDGFVGFFSKYYDEYGKKGFFRICSNIYYKNGINETDYSLDKLIEKFNKKMSKRIKEEH